MKWRRNVQFMELCIISASGNDTPSCSQNKLSSFRFSRGSPTKFLESCRLILQYTCKNWINPNPNPRPPHKSKLTWLYNLGTRRKFAILTWNGWQLYGNISARFHQDRKSCNCAARRTGVVFEILFKKFALKYISNFKIYLKANFLLNFKI